jgi:hypothetical protein
MISNSNDCANWWRISSHPKGGERGTKTVSAAIIAAQVTVATTSRTSTAIATQVVDIASILGMHFGIRCSMRWPIKIDRYEHGLYPEDLWRPCEAR